MRSLSLLPPALLVLAGGIVLAPGTRTNGARTKAAAPLLRGKAVGGATVAVPVPGARLTVVALTSGTCPLTLRYGPTLARLERAYAKKGVRFVFVNPEPDARAGEGAAARKRLGLSGPVVHDAAWAQKLGAKTTAETFVIDAAGTVRYRGAVDDQYTIGASLPAPRHRYLGDALEALLAGKAPKVTKTDAPGCLLALAPPAAPVVPVYHGDVERVVQANCLTCHREGGSAPFALDSYAAVKARAPMIQYAVERGIMPPWTAKPGSGPWRNDRTLSAGDRAKLTTWAEKGTPKGDPKRATKAPKFVPGWTIGTPDAVFALPQAVAIPAEGTMPYENVDVPTGLTEEKWVRAIEIVPGDRRVVHHVLVFALRPGQGRRGDGGEGLGGFFGGYVPGNSAMVYADGIAKRLPKGTVLRFQIHYTPNGTATTDRTKIGVIYAPKPEHEVQTLGLHNLHFAIPPRTKDYSVQAEVTTPFDARILSFLPHMHLRGQAARYEVIHPDATREPLLEVPRYDFNWQINYIYREPRTLHAGDRLVYTAWYDNTEGNRANPDPDKTVHWGEQTFDEMMLGYVEFIRPGATP